jgi:hypothetical protein
MMTELGMLSHEGRQWGNHDNNDGKEEVVEVDDNNEPLAVSGGDGRQ